MASFLSKASRRTTDVRGFLREAAGGQSIKYVAGKGEKHLLYIPYNTNTVVEDDGTERLSKELIAISGDVHEWQGLDGKYNATVCLRDVVRQSDDGQIMINDGSCAFCNRVGDAWNIFNYRKNMEEAQCKLTGEDRKKHLEKITSSLSNERKAKDARTFMYTLVVKYRTDASGSVIIGQDKLPEYDLKVMKLSSSRVEKIQQQVSNAGSDLPGSELIFEYPNTDDKRLQVSQSTTAPVFPNNMLTAKFPALIEKINTDVAKFEWEGIEKSFPEWNGKSTAEAEKITNELFEKWDQYNRDILVNPNVKYMEYITDTPVTNPALVGATPQITVPGQGVPTPTVAPAVATAAPTVAPTPDIPDANAVFGVNNGIGPISI